MQLSAQLMLWLLGSSLICTTVTSYKLFVLFTAVLKASDFGAHLVSVFPFQFLKEKQLNKVSISYLATFFLV